MNALIVAIIAALVFLAAIFYARSAQPSASSSTLSVMQALGAGIVGLAILLLAMPWAAGAIAAGGTGSEFAILSGAVYALGILALLGGIALVVIRNQSEG